MSSLKSSIALLLVCIVFFACQKDIDPVSVARENGTDTTGGGTTPTKYDSVNLLSRVLCSGQGGINFSYDYDSLNRLNQIKNPSGYFVNEPFSLYYSSNGKVSYIVSENKNGSGQIFKSSVIFQYGANGKVSKAYYKRLTDLYPDDLAPYYSTLSDGKYDIIDSLIYSANNRLEVFYRFENLSQTNWKLANTFNFYYTTPADTVAYKVEGFQPNQVTSTLERYDQILITTNSIDNVIYKQIPYSAFLQRLAGVTGASYKFPFLFDASSPTSLDQMLAFVPKCFSDYKVNNSSIVGISYTTIYNHRFSSDSLSFITSLSTFPQQYYSLYEFKKMRKR